MLEQKVTTLESMTIKFFKWLKWDTLVKKKKKRDVLLLYIILIQSVQILCAIDLFHNKAYFYSNDLIKYE